MVKTIPVGDTVLGLNVPDHPDLGAVTDGSRLFGYRSGTGLFNATALRSYVNVPVEAAIDAEEAARIAGDAANDAALDTAVATFRTQLTGNTQWFVDGALGNDANNGLTAGAGAFRTLQHAITTVQALYEGRGFTGKITVAAGVYDVGTGIVVDGEFPGFSQFTVECTTATLHSSQACITAQHGAQVYFSGGFTLTSGAGFPNVQSILHAQCHIGGIILTPSIGGSLLYVSRDGYMEIDADIHVATGTSGNLVQASHGANFRHSNAAIIHFDGVHVFSDCTLYSLSADLTITNNANFNTHGFYVQGQRFRAQGAGGYIQWAVGSPTAVPGDKPGNEQLGGRFFSGVVNNSQAAGTFTYDLATATGAVTPVTGVGFLPGTIDFIAAVATVSGPASVGMATAVYNGSDSTPGWNHCVGGGAVGSQPVGNACIGWNQAGGNAVAAAVTALNNDGFSLTWNKANAPTGTLTVYWRARRGV